MILYRVIIFIDVCIIMCIKLLHFILKIRTKQNIHNKNCDQDHRTNDAYNPTDQSCFRLISSCSSDFWCHRKTNDRCNPNDNCDWRAATTDHAYNCYDSKDHCCDRNSTCLLLLWLFYVIIFVTISSVWIIILCMIFLCWILIFDPYPVYGSYLLSSILFSSTF